MSACDKQQKLHNMELLSFFLRLTVWLKNVYMSLVIKQKNVYEVNKCVSYVMCRCDNSEINNNYQTKPSSKQTELLHPK